MTPSAFGVEHVTKSRRSHETEAAGGAAVVGNEVRGAVANHREGQRGRAISDAAKPQRHFRRIKGISDAGTKITQQTHPEGTYHISMDSLRDVRSRPSGSAQMPGLRDKIGSQGFTKPAHLKVYRNGAELWDGNHRAAVAAEKGLKSIPVSVEHVAGNKPRPTTLWGARNQVRHAQYRAGLRAAEAVAKSEGNPMATSAFGVEHEISKLSVPGMGDLLHAGTDALPHIKSAFGALKEGKPAGQHVDAAMGSLKSAFKPAAAPKRPMPGPGKAPGAIRGTGTRVGNFARQNKTGLAVGGGVGLGVGAYAGGRNK